MKLSRQQYTLLGIFALFLGPVILVMLMRSPWWQYQPAGLKNHGHLVQPAVLLPADEFQDLDQKWIILYVIDQPCEQACIEQVTSLRQIHKAAGRNREQLAILMLSQAPVQATLKSRFDSIYTQFDWFSGDETTTLGVLETINEKVFVNSGDSSTHTYILDPNRNVILAYGANNDPNDIHKDLKRLLKWSDQERS